MARAEVTVNTLNRAPTAVNSYIDIGTDGVKFKNTGKEFIIVKRDQASTSTITISTNVTIDGLALPDLTVAMAAGDSAVQEKILGPFPTQYYNQEGGYVHVDSDDSDDMIYVGKLVAVN